VDIVRTRRRPVGLRFVLPTLGAAAVLGSAWWATPNLLHGASARPSVARTAIVLDRARVGPLVRAIRAPGELVTDRVHIVAATNDALVASLAVRAGSRVAAGTVIAELRNPDLDAAVVDAGAQVRAARAELESAREEARAARLDRDGAYRSAVADAQRANEESATDASLIRDGLIGRLAYRQATIKAGETRALAQIAARKIAVGAAHEAARIAVAQAAADRTAASLVAARARVEMLVVRAGSAGVVQAVSAEAGQRMALGAEIARIAEERDLKAVLHVAEGDMRGIAPGMRVALETNGTGTLAGSIARIAPVAVNGSVALDVTLARIRPGMRPAQSVDGTIELLRLHHALTIARPVGAVDGTALALFRVARDGTHAYRTRVRLGTGSLDRVAVLAGLAAGESVIVSDTSAFAEQPELRITSL